MIGEHIKGPKSKIIQPLRHNSREKLAVPRAAAYIQLHSRFLARAFPL